MADAKEQQRLKMKADANFQRNLRYKDSRLRTIGQDVQALNMQVAEKKRQKELEQEESRIESASYPLSMFMMVFNSVLLLCLLIKRNEERGD